MARVDNKTNFKTASILEAVVWEYIEEEVLSPWLVGLAPDVQYHMRMIEKDIRNSRMPIFLT